MRLLFLPAHELALSLGTATTEERPPQHQGGRREGGQAPREGHWASCLPVFHPPLEKARPRGPGDHLVTPSI